MICQAYIWEIDRIQASSFRSMIVAQQEEQERVSWRPRCCHIGSITDAHYRDSKRLYRLQLASGHQDGEEGSERICRLLYSCLF